MVDKMKLFNYDYYVEKSVWFLSTLLCFIFFSNKTTRDLACRFFVIEGRYL